MYLLMPKGVSAIHLIHHSIAPCELNTLVDL
jgi:hypothetical protein